MPMLVVSIENCNETLSSTTYCRAATAEGKPLGIEYFGAEFDKGNGLVRLREQADQLAAQRKSQEAQIGRAHV